MAKASRGKGVEICRSPGFCLGQDSRSDGRARGRGRDLRGSQNRSLIPAPMAGHSQKLHRLFSHISILGCAFLVWLAASAFPFATPDLWGHLRAGVDELNTAHRFVAKDATKRTFMADESQWLSHERGFSLLVAEVYAGEAAVIWPWKGAEGLAALKWCLCLGVGLALGLSLFAAGARDQVWLLLFAVGIWFAAPHLILRPHLITLIGLSLVAWLGLAHGRGAWWPAAALLVMLPLWKLYHGGVLVGAIMALAYQVMYLKAQGRPWSERWRRELTYLGGWLLGMVLASIGPGQHGSDWERLWAHDGAALATWIEEWRPLWQKPERCAAFGGALALIAFWMWRHRQHVPHLMWFLTAAVAIDGLRFQRMSTWLGPLLLVPLAGVIAEVQAVQPAATEPAGWWRWLNERMITPWVQATRRPALAIGILLAVAVSLGLLNASEFHPLELYEMPGQMPREWVGRIKPSQTDGPKVAKATAPVTELAAAATLDAVPKVRLFCLYAWGHYCAWHFGDWAQVFVDGRAGTLYSEQVLQDYRLAIGGGAQGLEILDRARVDAVLIPRDAPLAAALQGDARWSSRLETSSGFWWRKAAVTEATVAQGASSAWTFDFQSAAPFSPEPPPVQVFP